MKHRTVSDLTHQLDHLRAAPSRHGTLTLVVCRPVHGEREVLAEGILHEVGEGSDRQLRQAVIATRAWRTIPVGQHH